MAGAIDTKLGRPKVHGRHLASTGSEVKGQGQGQTFLHRLHWLYGIKLQSLAVSTCRPSKLALSRHHVTRCQLALMASMGVWDVHINSTTSDSSYYKLSPTLYN